MMKSQKIPKTAFFGTFPDLATGISFFFFKYQAPSNFGYYHFASLCQNSEDFYGTIPRKAGNKRINRGGG